MKASASIVIDKPISEVWDFVSNIENMDKWVNGVREPKPISGGEWGVGSTFESGYEYAGKTHRITYEITGFDAPWSHFDAFHVRAVSVRGLDGTVGGQGWNAGGEYDRRQAYQHVPDRLVRCVGRDTSDDDADSASQGIDAAEGRVGRRRTGGC